MTDESVSSTGLLGPVCTDSGSPERPLVTAEAQHRKQADFSLTQGLITRYLFDDLHSGYIPIMQTKIYIRVSFWNN